MKLYTLNTSWKFGKIIECEVQKETEKTYTVEINGWGKNRVLKSNMSLSGWCFFKTYEELLIKLKEFLKQRIENANDSIKKQEINIKKYNSMLADIENGTVKNYDE